MTEKLKVLALLVEHSDGALWFDLECEQTPELFFNYVALNVEENQECTFKIIEVEKTDFERVEV